MLDCYLLSFCALKHSGGSFSNMTHAKLEKTRVKDQISYRGRFHCVSLIFAQGVPKKPPFFFLVFYYVYLALGSFRFLY